MLSNKKDLLTKKKDLLTQKKGLLTYTKQTHGKFSWQIAAAYSYCKYATANPHGKRPRQIAAANSHGKWPRQIFAANCYGNFSNNAEDDVK